MNTFMEALPGRRFRRKNVNAKARIFKGDQVTTTDALQISEGGLLVAMTAAPKMGEEFYVHITILKTYIRAKVNVNYILKTSEEPDAGYSIGLKFAGLTEAHREAIQKYLMEQEQDAPKA